jgi:hypothetical protein
MQTYHFLPLTPKSNPDIEEGGYEAEVKSFELKTYGEQSSTLVHIVLRLIDPEKTIVTQIYFPNNDAPGSNLRLWYFCNSVGLELGDVTDNPELFEGRSLCVQIRQFSKSYQDSDDCYSDVAGFYPLRSDEHDDPYEIW